jgi:hypothetical protein
MTIYGIPEATYFCSGYRGTPGNAAGSFTNFTTGLTTGQAFTEGSSDFDTFRDCSLRESERLLFLAMAHYRRSFSLLSVSTASWAQVTMYYSAFYSAKSLLGMFGGWFLKGKKIIDVAKSAPGKQELIVGKSASTYRGSHQVFWDHFYANIAALDPWIEPPLRFAIAPVNGDVTWQIDRRNEVNYDSFTACDLMKNFQVSFRKTRVTSSLPGVLNTQFQVMEALLRLAAGQARKFRLATDALSAFSPKGDRRQKVRALIINEALPSLDRNIKRRILTG